MSSDFQLFSSFRFDPLLLPLARNTDHWDGDIKNWSPFYILPLHRDRILEAAEHFGWKTAADRIRGYHGFRHFLQKLHAAVDVWGPVPLRVKAMIDRDGEITIESSPTPVVSERNLLPEWIPPPPILSSKAMTVSPLTGGTLTLGADDVVLGRSMKREPVRGEPWDVIPDTSRTSPSPYTSYKTTNRDVYTEARVRVGIKNFAERREVLMVSDKDGSIMEGSLTSVYFWRNGKWTTPPITSGGQVGTTRRWALEQGYCVEGVIKADELVDGEECWISNGVRGFILGKVNLSPNTN